MNILPRISHTVQDLFTSPGYEDGSAFLDLDYKYARLEGLTPEQAQDYAEMCYVKDTFIPLPHPDYPV